MVRKHLANSLNAASSKLAASLSGDSNLTWEQLQSIEKRRRAILRRQTDYGFFRIVFFWDGTLLKMLSKDRLMWLTMFIYIIIRVFAHLDALPEVLNDIAGADIGVIGVFLSFFLVLFVNDANHTVEKIYDICMECKGRVMDVASLSKTTLPRAYALRLVRYMNAVHIAGYVGLSRVYTYDNFFLPLNKTHRFLTDEEVARITEINMNLGGSAYRELIVWCMQEVSEAEQQGLLDGFLASQFRKLILSERVSMAQLYNDDDQPISFAYYHFVCFLSFVYLPLFAMSAALDAGIGEAAYWLTDIVAGFIVMLQAIFVVGLRVLAENMSDPFGSDVDNLSVLHYIIFTWQMSNRILASPKQKPVDSQLEERISKERTDIGNPWDDDEERLREASEQKWSHNGTFEVDEKEMFFGAQEEEAVSPSYH